MRPATTSTSRRPRSLAVALLVACAATACSRSGEAVRYPAEASALPPEARFLAEIDRTRGTRDCFVPITDGRFVSAADARRMQPGERVLGLRLDGESVAYPLQYLNLAEIVEHTLAGRELLVCW